MKEYCTALAVPTGFKVAPPAGRVVVSRMVEVMIDSEPDTEVVINVTAVTTVTAAAGVVVCANAKHQRHPHIPIPRNLLPS